MKASCWKLHWVISVQGLPFYKGLTQDPPVLLTPHETRQWWVHFSFMWPEFAFASGVEEGIFVLSSAPSVSGSCQQFMVQLTSDPPVKKNPQTFPTLFLDCWGKGEYSNDKKYCSIHGVQCLGIKSTCRGKADMEFMTWREAQFWRGQTMPSLWNMSS